jgi:hypothetical protein
MQARCSICQQHDPADHFNAIHGPAQATASTSTAAPETAGCCEKDAPPANQVSAIVWPLEKPATTVTATVPAAASSSSKQQQQQQQREQDAPAVLMPLKACST